MTQRPPFSREIRRIASIGDPPIQAAIDEEIAFHVESRMTELRAQGFSESDARRIALAEYGDVQASRRELAAVDRHLHRRRRIARSLDGIAQDIRHALRSLRRRPTFCLAALGTLAIGIGALTAMFAIVDAILLRPLPYRDPGRLVGAWHDMPAINLPHASQSPQTYFTYSTQARTIGGIGIYREAAANVSTVNQSSDPQRLDIAGCTASLFRVLGVTPLRGRVFTQEEDGPGGAPVAVIGEALWRSTFGSDRDVIGKLIDVDGQRRRIVGVLPRSFGIPASRVALWVPLGLDPANPPPTAFAYGGIARLKSGVSPAMAERDFAAVLPRAADLYPQFVPGISTRQILAQTKPRPMLTPLRDDVVGAVSSTLWITAAAATLLYLVACINVGNLALVRFDARQSELAMRQALGASRGRLARSYFAEIAIIASAACPLALAIARMALGLLASKGPADLPRLVEVAVDWQALLFALIASVCAALLSGVIPLHRLGRRDLGLTRGTRGGTASRAANRTRETLVAVQIALALFVLAASGLLVRSFSRLNSVRPGFDADHVATYWVSLPVSRYGTDTAMVRFYGTLLERTRVLPGVARAGLTSRLPLVQRGFNDNPLYPEDAITTDGKLPPLQLFTTVSRDYFQAMDIPLLSGKLFDAIHVQREGDAIISSRTAAMFWHDSTGRSVIGKRFRVLPTSRWYTVVGVVAGTRDSSLATVPSPVVYFPETEYTDPAGPRAARTMALVVRTAGDPAALAPAIQRIVHEMDAALPVFDVQSMANAVRASTARLRFTVLVLGAAALVTLALGALGLYGVMAYVVVLRRREIGIRIALGATPTAVASATTREAMVVTGIGLAAGLALFVAAAPLARSMVFGVAARDPVAMGGALSVLLVAAMCASWIPARRAARVDPVETLRADG